MIQLENITHSYDHGNGKTDIFSNLNLHIPSGQWLMIVGANGSGKSTLIRLLSGSQPLRDGTISLNGILLNPKSFIQRSEWIAQVFQQPDMGIAAQLSVAENYRIASLRGRSRNIWRQIDKKFIQKAQEELSLLGLDLEHKIHQPAGTLSGGQKQALSLLMAVAAPCQLLLMDEPTAALDPRSAERVMRLSEKIVREKQLICITVTHDMKDAAKYGDRIVQLDQGRVRNDMLKSPETNISAKDLLDWFE